MPTYEYECQRCAHVFERFQSITQEPVKKCPACKGKVRRMIGSGAGLLFKGSGFYITDYRKESYNKERKAEQSAASGGNSGSNGKKKAPDGKTSEKNKQAAATATSGGK